MIDEEISIKNIRMEVAALKMLEEDLAVIEIFNKLHLRRAELLTEVLEIIDKNIDFQINVGELLTRDIGRWVIYTGDKEIKRGRIKGWSTTLNLVHVVFDEADQSDWIDYRSTRCEPAYLRFESMDLNNG